MVRLCPDKRMVNPSPAYTVQLSLEKGDALDLAYRLPVHAVLQSDVCIWTGCGIISRANSKGESL